MEIQNKLDEDFLFYLGFIKSGINKFKDNKKIYNLCQAWLDKLCGEVAGTTNEKRKRNIYLSQLVLCMEEGKLTPPFSSLPLAVLPKTTEYFPPTLPEIKEPSWMTEVLTGDGDKDQNHEDARTYIATKALPDGKGALAYIALSLDDEEFEYKGEGLDEHMKKKFEEYVPPISEMERILLNRKLPEERQKVLAFYNLIAQNIAKEIDGKVPSGSNAHTNGLIQQLINNLKQKGEFEKYEAMPPEEQRLELLYLLDSRFQERIMHIKKREDFLDHIEMEEMNASFFETSLLPEDIHKEHRASRPSKMWTQAINSGPSQKLIRELGKYPPFIVKRFLGLLANEKEKIAIKVQRRHENVYSQLKKELRKEGEKGLRKYERTKVSHDEIVEIKNAILAAEKRCYESYQQRQELLTGHRKERDELYEQTRKAMFDTQEHVEEEAAYGKYLSKQINSITTQAEVIQQVNEESLQKVEDDNIAIMKNIQRLAKHIQQHENRISNLKQVLAKSAVESGSQFFFV